MRSDCADGGARSCSSRGRRRPGTPRVGPGCAGQYKCPGQLGQVDLDTAEQKASRTEVATPALLVSVQGVKRPLRQGTGRCARAVAPGSPAVLWLSGRRKAGAVRAARAARVSRGEAGRPLPERSSGAERGGGGGHGGGSPDPAGGERADRIWSLREAWSEVAPYAAGPRGGAQLCGGLEAPAPPQYLRACRWGPPLPKKPGLQGLSTLRLEALSTAPGAGRTGRVLPSAGHGASLQPLLGAACRGESSFQGPRWPSSQGPPDPWAGVQARFRVVDSVQGSVPGGLQAVSAQEDALAAPARCHRRRCVLGSPPSFSPPHSLQALFLALCPRCPGPPSSQLSQSSGTRILRILRTQPCRGLLRAPPELLGPPHRSPHGRISDWTGEQEPRLLQAPPEPRMLAQLPIPPGASGPTTPRLLCPGCCARASRPGILSGSAAETGPSSPTEPRRAAGLLILSREFCVCPELEQRVPSQSTTLAGGADRGSVGHHWGAGQSLDFGLEQEDLDQELRASAALLCRRARATELPGDTGRGQPQTCQRRPHWTRATPNLRPGNSRIVHAGIKNTIRHPERPHCTTALGPSAEPGLTFWLSSSRGGVFLKDPPSLPETLLLAVHREINGLHQEGVSSPRLEVCKLHRVNFRQVERLQGHKVPKAAPGQAEPSTKSEGSQDSDSGVLSSVHSPSQLEALCDHAGAHSLGLGLLWEGWRQGRPKAGVMLRACTGRGGGQRDLALSPLGVPTAVRLGMEAAAVWPDRWPIAGLWDKAIGGSDRILNGLLRAGPEAGSLATAHPADKELAGRKPRAPRPQQPSSQGYQPCPSLRRGGPKGGEQLRPPSPQPAWPARCPRFRSAQGGLFVLGQALHPASSLLPSPAGKGQLQPEAFIISITVCSSLTLQPPPPEERRGSPALGGPCRHESTCSGPRRTTARPGLGFPPRSVGTPVFHADRDPAVLRRQFGGRAKALFQTAARAPLPADRVLRLLRCSRPALRVFTLRRSRGGAPRSRAALPPHQRRARPAALPCCGCAAFVSGAGPVGTQGAVPRASPPGSSRLLSQRASPLLCPPCPGFPGVGSRLGDAGQLRAAGRCLWKSGGRARLEEPGFTERLFCARSAVGPEEEKSCSLVAGKQMSQQFYEQQGSASETHGSVHLSTKAVHTRCLCRPRPSPGTGGSPARPAPSLPLRTLTGSGGIRVEWSEYPGRGRAQSGSLLLLLLTQSSSSRPPPQPPARQRPSIKG
ncbi:PREDICTED: uncharacterized protein LOC106148274 [Chinchilla lanigera]|uniref:uncharacterized protein LOC106148274 n=1 Tax=Chinchilla lanigera TaxID=34839 RepID=UPI000696BC11|nr:PREDICTED: uncharacterized protein LOC106148274 [Chinchilla lanigera]